MQVSWYPSLLWFFFLRNLAVTNKMTYNKCIHIMKESGHKEGRTYEELLGLGNIWGRYPKDGSTCGRFSGFPQTESDHQ